MKKVLCLMLAATMVLFANGCSSGGGTANTSNSAAAQQHADGEARKQIEEQLENHTLPKGFAGLLEDGDFVTVLCTNGEAKVTVKAFANFAIPNVAEEYLPVAQDAAEAAEVTLSEFTVTSYNVNKDGVVEDTLSNWTTKDGNAGILTDTTSGENIIKQGMTIEQLYEYYDGYKEIVEQVIAEGGGK